MNKRVYELIGKLVEIINQMEEDYKKVVKELAEIKTLKQLRDSFDLQDFYENENVRKANELIKVYDIWQK